jgi:signal transduction histidine kinase
MELARRPVVAIDHRSDALLEALAAGIAHEVRNPLNALQLNIELLEEELHATIPERDARVYAILAKVSSELASLDAFVSEFLRYARPARLRLESVPIRPLITEFAAFVAPECARKNVDLVVLTERCHVTMQADALQLKRAVLNLVLNAIHATPPGGRITLECQADDRSLFIRVRDTGEGIRPEAKAHLFDVFYTTKEGGSGLGLPIALRIAEAHGGTLEIENDPKGGAVATLVLPVRH